MKHIILYLFAFVGCLALTACGSDGPEDITPDYTGKEYTETYSIPAEGCNTTYSLKNLSSKITTISTTPDWLTISKQAYTTGAPGINITAKANTAKDERKCTVVITTDKGDKLTLTLTQAGAKQEEGKEDDKDEEDNEDKEDNEDNNNINDIHNETSGKPAYVKRR